MSWRMLSGRRPGILTRGGSLLAVLITLELATRLFRPDQMQRTIFDPDLGYKLRPHVQELTTDRESGETLTLNTNSFGFRGAEWRIPKPAGLRRIAVLGNSFVEAQGYDDARTFCGRLDQRLNHSASPDGVRWEVMNFGISGYSTASELALYRKTVRQFEPDIVLLCTSIAMDVRGNCPRLAQSHKRVFPQIRPSGEIALIPPPSDRDSNWRYGSKLYVWQKNRMQQLIDAFRALSVVDEIVDPTEKLWRSKLEPALTLTTPPLDEPLVESWDITTKLLSRFRDEVATDGAEFLVLNLPDAWQIDLDRLRRFHAEVAPRTPLEPTLPETELARIADELDLILLDLTGVFREAAEPHGRTEELFLRGAGHFTAQGHELVARAALPFLFARSRALSFSRERLAVEPNHAAIR